MPQGLSWFGAESSLRIPDGLRKRPLTSLLSFMADNSFNTLRLFFSLQNILENKPTPSHFDAEASPQLVNTDFIGMLAAITREAAKYGIGVLLANRQIRDGYPDLWPGDWDGNWFDEDYQPELILEIWTKLAKRLCVGDLWNVIGVE